MTRTYQPDAQARVHARALEIIALRAREMAVDQRTDTAGAATLRDMAAAVQLIGAHSRTICHAGGNADLAALVDALGDVCAVVVSVHHAPPLSDVERQSADLDFRNKQMREDA